MGLPARRLRRLLQRGLKVENAGETGKIYKPALAPDARVPENIKINLESTFELFLDVLILLSILASITIFSIGGCGSYDKKTNRYRPADTEVLFTYLPAALLITGFAIYGRYRTDNYYIFDTANKRILYHFKFLWYESSNPYLESGDIHAIGVTGDKRYKKTGKADWSYTLVVVDRQANMISLSDPEGQGALADLNEKADGLAAVTGCYAALCPKFGTLEVTGRGAGSEPSLAFRVDADPY